MNHRDDTETPALWTPSPERVAATRLDELRRELAEVTGANLPDSLALHQFSLDHPGDFWDVVWGECGVEGDRGDGPAYVLPPAGSDMRSAQFFPAATLNFSENLLAGGNRAGASETAVVFRREDGIRRTLSWRELRDEVAAMRAYLESVGVVPADRVAAWVPNIPEAIVMMLATASLGATFTSTSPDFGVAGVLDRFGQVAPSVLLAADGYVYANRRHDRLERLGEVVAGLPSLRSVVVHGELDPNPDLARVRSAAGGREVVSWKDALAAGNRRIESRSGLVETRLFAFDQPLYILYSSGTTGAPKCIIHRAGGVLLKHMVEQQLHCDIRPGDRVLYFTTCGWMMWNWLVSTLASGATVVLYDGSPFHPARDVMWDLVDEERVTLFGTSAKYLDTARKAGAEPVVSHEFADLRTICSTGSPLSVEGFDFVYQQVKSDVHLASISGGTDICGCFVMGDPTRPVFAGEIQGPALGMAIDVWDADAKSLRPIYGDPASAGRQGELVCTAAFPSMPLGFWADPADSRYLVAYFSRYPGVWAQGDFAAWTEHGGVIISGRSDATLNAAGVRIGTAEIYREVEILPEVAEALAIGQEWDDDTRIVLFVKLSVGSRLSDDLVGRITRGLRENCSPRHVPARVVAVADLPRTRSGKLAELAVSDVVHGRPVRNREALANACALDHFVDLSELTK